MSSESIERFYFENDQLVTVSDGPFVRYSDHQRIVKELEAQTCTGEHDGTVKECAFCAEIRRWQDGIRDHLIKQFDVPDGRIDGAGCDSGDPLDFTLAEITQGIGYLIDDRPSLSDAIKEVEKMRDKWDVDAEAWNARANQQTNPDLAVSDFEDRNLCLARKEAAEAIIIRLKSLGTQRED